MKEFRKSIFIAIILMSFGMTAPFAAGLDGNCTPADTIAFPIQCDTGLYCNTIITTHTCKACPIGYPSSDAGTTSESQCYKQISCPDSTDVVPNGTIKPDEASIKNFNEKTAKECKYTNRANLTCNTNYHLDPNSTALECFSNCKKCNIGPHTSSADKTTVTGTGCQWWSDKDNSYSSVCRSATCNYGYHPIHISNLFLNKSYCNPNTIKCTDWPISLNADGGDAVYNRVDTDDPPSADNKGFYNTKQCFKNKEYTSASGNGSGKQKCFHTSGFSDEDTIYNYLCEITAINSCKAGYYHPNPDAADCIPTDQGYYSPTGKITQDPCPVGMTSTPPATAKKECFYKGKAGGTKFCDNNGCFYLPDDVTF